MNFIINYQSMREYELTMQKSSIKNIPAPLLIKKIYIPPYVRLRFSRR